MSNTKQCKQCGDLKPIEQFRRYYGGRKGTYKTCKLCEKINAREKYLEAKYQEGCISEDEVLELGKIHKLWEAQAKLGYQPPIYKVDKTSALSDSIDGMISRYEALGQQVAVVKADAPQQPELIIWLSAKLTKEPEYYLDYVYEELKRKYRPVLRIDQATMLPVHDDTYRDILEQILDRFYEYDEAYEDAE